MEEFHVANGEHKVIGHVVGDLIVGNNAIIDVEDQQLKVTGCIRCKGSAVFNGNILANEFAAEDGKIRVNGNMEIANKVEIEDGSLFVDGTLIANTVNVDNELDISDTLKAKDVSVGGKLHVEQRLEAYHVSVGGSLLVEGETFAQTLSVGGTINIHGTCNVEQIDIGGSAKIVAGKIKKISVGGTLKVKSNFQFEKANVGGVASFLGDILGGDINVGGVIKVAGSAQLGVLNVGGVAKIKASCKCRSMKVGGVIKVGTSLEVEESLIVGGSVKVDGPITAKEIKVGDSISGTQINASVVHVGGRLFVDKYIKADEVKIGKGGKIRGIVIGSDVLIRKKATAEDIYSQKISVEPGAVVKSLYGHNIYLDSCKVTGNVLYTEVLEVRGKVRFSKKPEKVDELPPPPSFE